jgi:hypothetical protein
MVSANTNSIEAREMVATIQFEIHDPSGNQNNVVTINFERDATYE